jgi:DNA-binding LacI/PurR family transcriptional regulator
MTSVRLPLRQMGRIAGEMLTSDALHDTPSTPREIVPELIVRNSTVALRP